MVSSLLVASSTNIGGRQKQEDKVVTVPDLNVHVPAASELDRGVARSYFAVFDGHGGAAASSFLAKTFHISLAKNPLLASDPKAALLDVWQSMDGEIYQLLAQTQRVENARLAATSGGQGATEAPFPRDGSTATVLLLVGNKLFSANCGDSAGILVKKDGTVRSITENHDTLDPNEFDRIKKIGGMYREQVLKVRRKWPRCCGLQDVVVGKPRVCGLLVTRSFGDFSCKLVELGGTPGIILADCGEVLELTIEEDWAEVVIATDGVWDVLQAKETPQVLARLEGKDASKAAALRLPAASGSNDGISKHGSMVTTDAAVTEVHVTVGEGSPVEHVTTARRRQAELQLQCACAKLVLACVRHRYWALHQAAADNASAVILRFGMPQQ